MVFISNPCMIAGSLLGVTQWLMWNMECPQKLHNWHYWCHWCLVFIKSVMSETGFFYWDQDWDFGKISLDIDTGIKTFRISLLILRLVSRLFGLQSWYQDWFWDFYNCSLDIETSIKTFMIAVLILSLVLRLFIFQYLIKKCIP